MELLIDTHALIWFITDDSKLPIETKKIIETSDNKCFVSVATYWEIAIKYSFDRLLIDFELAEIFRIIENAGFELLPITPNQILINAALPHHHHDPFDRTIIAQAIYEDLKVVSIDEKFKNYNISIVWNN